MATKRVLLCGANFCLRPDRTRAGSRSSLPQKLIKIVAPSGAGWLTDNLAPIAA